MKQHDSHRTSITSMGLHIGLDSWFVGEISIPHDPVVGWWLPSLKNCFFFAFEHTVGV